MKTIPVKVILKTNITSFNEALPFGFETAIESVVTDTDEVIPAAYRSVRTKDGMKVVKMCDEHIVPAGSYQYARFKGANGEMYTTDIIKNMIGYKPFSQIFSKL